MINLKGDEFDGGLATLQWESAISGSGDYGGNDVEGITIRRLADDLDAHGIEYVSLVTGPWNRYGYQRIMSGVDVVLSAGGAERFHSELVGDRYRPTFPGANKKFRATDDNVPIEVITTDEYPGDGLPKSVRFPDPATEYVIIDGIRTVPLPRLVELKLASGLTGRGRAKDFGDVQELIRILKLPAEFAEQLAPSVRAKFVELYDDLHGESEIGSSRA